MQVSFSSLIFYDYIYDLTNGILLTEVKAGRIIETSYKGHRKGGVFLIFQLFTQQSSFKTHSTTTKYLLGGWHSVEPKRKLKEISSVPSRVILIASVLMKISRCHRSLWERMTNSAWESWEILTGGDVTLNYKGEKRKR